MNAAPLAVCALALGCSYPEFAFAPEASPEADIEAEVAGETAVTLDSALVEDAESDDVAEAPCACAQTERCVAGACLPHTSCAALHAAAPALASGVYTLDPDGDGPVAPFSTYCEMVAAGGGWTLVIKADGTKSTFAFDSPLWTNDAVLNPTSPALDTTEAKLASFHTMSFTALRVGMVDGTPRYIAFDIGGPSLRSLFSAGSIPTKAGRATWLALLSSGRLQPNCNAEGINHDFSSVTSYAARARIGIFGNNELDCSSPDSYIAFGAGFVMPHMCVGPDPGVVVGNFMPLSCGGSAGNERTTPLFGYVFLR